MHKKYPPVMAGGYFNARKNPYLLVSSIWQAKLDLCKFVKKLHYMIKYDKIKLRKNLHKERMTVYGPV